MPRGNQIPARRKGNAVHGHVADDINPTGDQTKDKNKILLRRTERTSWTTVGSRTWEESNPDTARAHDIEHGENAE